MPSKNLSHDDWLGKLVWYFPRDEKGLTVSNKAISGIVIDMLPSSIGREDCKAYIVLSGLEKHEAWEGDLELVEEWDESLEGENSQMEKPRERTRELDRDSS